MKYNNVPADRDYGLNYGGCFACMRTEDEIVPVYLEGTEDQLIARRADGSGSVAPDSVDVSWPKLGMRNCIGSRCAIYVFKRASRQYRRGPKPSNCSVEGISHDGNRRCLRAQSAFEHEAQELYSPTYPSLAYALHMLERKWASVALTEEIALSSTGAVVYKRWKVGYYDKATGVCHIMTGMPSRVLPACQEAFNNVLVGD